MTSLAPKAYYWWKCIQRSHDSKQRGEKGKAYPPMLTSWGRLLSVARSTDPRRRDQEEGRLGGRCYVVLGGLLAPLLVTRKKGIRVLATEKDESVYELRPSILRRPKNRRTSQRQEGEDLEKQTTERDSCY